MFDRGLFKDDGIFPFEMLEKINNINNKDIQSEVIKAIVESLSPLYEKHQTVTRKELTLSLYKKLRDSFPDIDFENSTNKDHHLALTTILTAADRYSNNS